MSDEDDFEIEGTASTVDFNRRAELNREKMVERLKQKLVSAVRAQVAQSNDVALKRQFDFEFQSLSAEDKKKRIADDDAREKRNADAKARFEENQKKKAKEKRESDKLEAQQKRTRGIMDLKSFFSDGKIKARGRIDNVMREVAPRAKQPQEPAPVEAKKEKPIVVDIEYIAGRVGPLEEGDHWMTEAEASVDPMMARAFRFLTSQPVRGCGNDVDCNAEQCEHEADIEVSPLEALLNPLRPKRRDRVMRATIAVNPFLDIAFPLRDYLEKLPNIAGAHDPLLTSAVRNNDELLRAAMSRATVDIEDVLLNERRRYHAELASQKKSLDYKRHELAKKIENLRQFARSIGDHITLDSLDEEMHQLYEQLNHEDEAHRAVLKKTVLAKIEQQMTASGQQFSLSRKLTASAMLDIIMLADGRRRDDAFYRQLAIDVRCGVLGNLHRELQRETKERGYADRAPSPEREAQKTERQLEDELFMQRVLRNGVKTVKERQREREREVSAMQTDDDDAVEEAPPEQEKKAVVHKRPRLEETPVPAAVPPPQPRASPPREVVVISDDGTWLDVAEFWKGVCEPQTVPACTPIAYMCAMRFATAVPVDAETYDDKVSALEYDRFVRNGTRLWEAWFENEQKKAPEKRNAWMHAVDVKNEKVLASIKASKLETFECAGPWLASSSIANRELYKPLAEWLEHIASLAQDGQFGTLFTLRTRTIAIGHCGNKYYVFDSHGGSEKAVLLCFSTLGKLVEGISRRFNRSHEVEQRELQKCHGDEFGLQKEFSYSLYAMYKPQGA